MEPRQGILLPMQYLRPATRKGTSSTFNENIRLPIHRWFRYPAGFSAVWTGDLIAKEKANGRERVLDPFAGSGTVLLEAELCGVSAVGLESHPFVARVAEAKLLWRKDASTFRNMGLEVLAEAKRTKGCMQGYPKLIYKCFPPEILIRLGALKKACERSNKEPEVSDLVWLVLASILRECSPVGTAQWQYILPNKRKAKSLDPYEAFEKKVLLMSDDMLLRQQEPEGPQAVLYQEDARECSCLDSQWADLVVSSPPYANNYDYADATRLELSFFGEISGWSDLQKTIRKYLIRSCTQHVARNVNETDVLLANPLLDPIRQEIVDVCERLGKERENHGGKKPYHTMIAAYFLDLAETWVALRRVTKPGALVCFVIGDSAPYGIHVPVEKWLGELAIAADFHSFEFEKTRDRNVKWKNRKHRVPLQEGRLWIKG